MRILVVIVTLILTLQGKIINSLNGKLVEEVPGWVGIDKHHKIHKIRRRKADGTHHHHHHNSYHAPVSTSYGSPAPPPPSTSYGSPAIPAPTSYGSPAAPAVKESVDLHNEEFCVDVSTYQPVVWVERDGEECKTEFVKQCEDRTEEVCAEVTETTCQVVPYKECKQGVEPQQFSQTKLAPKKFIEKSCIQAKKTIPHKK